VAFCFVFVCCCVWFAMHNCVRGGLQLSVFGVSIVSVLFWLWSCAGESHFFLVYVGFGYDGGFVIHGTGTPYNQYRISHLSSGSSSGLR
jgi:hypothetical protein